MKLVFGDFLPDLPDHGSPGVSDVRNLYPTSAGYRPVPAWWAHSNPLPTACRGAAAFIAPSGRSVLIAATDTSLWRLNGIDWVEIGTGYTSGTRWRFVQFGQMAIATNSVDAMVKIDLETDAVALLGGSPPKFQALAVVSNFVVGTQLNGDVSTIGWSGENNAEWWTFAQRKSDYQELADGGEITGIIGGETGLILQRNAVRRMTYVGGNLLFRIDKVSAIDGCASVHSVGQYGELAFWHSLTGFKMWDGVRIRPIGYEKVDDTFSGRFGQVDYAHMSTAIDGQKNTVCWSTGQTMWLYNWALDKWSIIEHAAEIVTQRSTAAPGLEEQDVFVGAPDDNVDNNLDPFDFARFVGGDPTFYSFTDGAVGTFNGYYNKKASITGRLTEMIEGRDVRIRKVRPLTDATAGVTIRLDTKQRLGDLGTRRDFTTLQPSGEMPVRARGRYAMAKVTIEESSDWTYLQGVDATISAGGAR